MTLALTGVAIGLIAALAFSRLVSGLLFGVKSTDRLTFTLVAALLTIVTLIASYVPARRATRIDLNDLFVLRLTAIRRIRSIPAPR